MSSFLPLPGQYIKISNNILILQPMHDWIIKDGWILHILVMAWPQGILYFAAHTNINLYVDVEQEINKHRWGCSEVCRPGTVFHNSCTLFPHVSHMAEAFAERINS